MELLEKVKKNYFQMKKIRVKSNHTIYEQFCNAPVSFPGSHRPHCG